jgi:hypothetical protein
MKFDIKEDAPIFADEDTISNRILEYGWIQPRDYLKDGPTVEEVERALAIVEEYANAVWAWHRARIDGEEWKPLGLLWGREK